MEKTCQNCKHYLTYNETNPLHPCHVCRVPEYEVDRWEFGDLVEVVRCKDCKHYEKTDENDFRWLISDYWCFMHDAEMEENDFCNRGVKRNEI